jgi:uroporphyrinogen decarboxylase
MQSNKGSAAEKSRFLRACRGEEVDSIPVWFMRQAGRSFAEYRALRAKHSMLELCRTPELAAEVTLQPVRRLGVDAAILFSDIVVPLAPMGMEIDIEEGIGPVIEDPVRSEADVGKLRTLDPSTGVPHVIETVELLAGELDVPLIGFAGAPFTLASYMVQGKASKDHAATKALMHSSPRTWDKLMQVVGDSMTAYLRAQVTAGAAAVQLFDSWAGALDPDDYITYVAPAVQRIFEGLADLRVPRIYFGVGTSELLELMAATGADVIGVDWRVPLDRARARLPACAVQGNLDPAACLAPWGVLETKALSVLERGGGRGHVFNLGHGVLPATDPATLERLVQLVHGWRPNGG